MLELWLIRHGQSTWNAAHRIQGRGDAPLSELGRDQARRLEKRLANVAFDAVYASDLTRAYDTACLALPSCRERLVVEPRIREIDVGVFEGRVFTELDEGEVETYRAWYRGPFDRRLPGGESGDDLLCRVRAWLDELPDSGRVIAFSHGGAIGAMLHAFLGRPAAGSVWGVRVRNTGITRLSRIDGDVVIDAVNDVAHLAGLDE